MAFDLPERFEPEWVTQRPWRKTQYSELEACELGMLRRPQDSFNPGSLVYAMPNKDHPPRYRITKLGGTKEKYVVNVEDLMVEVFGRFANRNLLTYSYLHKLKILCMEYNRRYFTGGLKRDSLLLGPTNPSQVVKKRKCAGVNGKSCGRMIYDYRCPACWVMIRGGVADNDEMPTYRVGL